MTTLWQQEETMLETNLLRPYKEASQPPLPLSAIYIYGTVCLISI